MIEEVVLAALYLRGAPRSTDPPRRGWPQMLAALRRDGASLGSASETLRRVGADLAATVLDTSGLLAWAEKVVEDEAALTVATEGYPLRWLEAFGDLAPPALWRNGSPVATAWVGAVGSRQVPEETVEFMQSVGTTAVALGWGIVSGGAAGCDSAAEQAALAAGGAVIRILPHGLTMRSNDDGATNLSLAAPSEPFSRPLAMERNALIYGAAEATVVGHARMRQGGTWHGAADALRRRLGRLLVRADGSPASRALRALGAEELSDSDDLETLLASGAPQRTLFAYESRQLRSYQGTA